LITGQRIEFDTPIKQEFDFLRRSAILAKVPRSSRSLATAST